MRNGTILTNSMLASVLVLAILLASCADRAAPKSGSSESIQTASAPSNAEPAFEVLPEPQPEPAILSEDIPVVAPTLCDGLGSAGYQDWSWVSDRPALATGDAVQQITVCSGGSGYLPGSGKWSTFETRTVPADLLPAMITALSVPDEQLEEGTICATVGYGFSDVVVRLADGRVFSARIPGDGCTPSPEVLDLLGRIHETVLPVVTRDELLIPDSTLMSGCSGRKPFFPTLAADGAIAAMPLDLGSAYSVCVHDESPEATDDLIAEGQATPSAVIAAIASMSPEPPPGCEWPPAGIDGAGIAAYITLVPTPMTPPEERPDLSSPEPVLTVSTDDCHIAVDASWNIVGWMDDQAVDALMPGG